MPERLRPIKITENFLKFADSSTVFQMGNTKVLSTITVKEGESPPFATAQNSGWITAEYSMLPRSTPERTSRQRTSTSGRTQEIQRIIGRSLRAVVDLRKLGNRTLIVDCDVLQADGGTRTAAINGAFVALMDTMKKLLKEGKVEKGVVKNFLGAVSVGIVNGKKVIDLNYEEDSVAEVDLNIVMTEDGKIIEIQGTAERFPFSKASLDDLLQLAHQGIRNIIKKIKEKVGSKLI